MRLLYRLCYRLLLVVCLLRQTVEANVLIWCYPPGSSGPANVVSACSQNYGCTGFYQVSCSYGQSPQYMYLPDGYAPYNVVGQLTYTPPNCATACGGSLGYAYTNVGPGTCSLSYGPTFPGGWQSCTNGGGGGGGSASLPYYYFLVPGWTNTSGAYASFGYTITGTNGTQSSPWTVSVPPGGSVGPLGFTNTTSFGTACYGDQRSDSTLSPICVSMSTGYYSGSGAPPNPAPTPGQSNIGNSGYPGAGGTTNVASNADIQNLGAALLSGDAGTTKAIEYASGVSSNLLAASTNLLGRILSAGGTGTNGGGGTGSNVFVMNFPTNYSDYLSRSYESNLVWFNSNFAWAQSNSAFALQDGASNVVATYTNMVETNLDVAGFMTPSSVSNQLNGAASDFGAAVAGSSGNNYVLSLTGTNWDITRYVLGWQTIEDKLPGFRGWVRLLFLWGGLLGFIFLYAADLRQYLTDVFTGGQIQVNPQAAGALSLIPGVNVGARTIVVLAVMLILAFVPSIVVASVSTMLTSVSSASVSAAASSFHSVVGSPPPSVSTVAYYIENVVPVVELLFFALNYIGVRFWMDVLFPVLWGMCKGIGL